MTLPLGFSTDATMMPSPTSCGSSRRVAPCAWASATAWATSSTPQYVVGLDAVCFGRHEAQFIAGDVEADVEGLVEVGTESEEVGPPRLVARRRSEVG